MKKLSIIIPYYNGGHYIGNLLEDLIQQDFKEEEYEVIVVDDGSTESVAVLKSYCERYSNIIYISQENHGVSTARNKGIKHARGEYVAFCDCDDRIRRNVLNQVYDVAKQNDLQMLFFNPLILKENEEPRIQNMCTVLSEDIVTGVDYYAKRPYMRMECWNFIIQKKFVDSCGFLFPEHIVYHEDIVFLLRALLDARRVSYINSDIYYYIYRPQSAIHYSAKVLKASKVADNRMWIINELFGIITRHPDLPCKNCLLIRIRMLSFQMLHHSFRYLSVRKNKELIHQLKGIGGYPFEEGRYYGYALHITYKLMQVYPLWMTCCCIYHLFPKNLRNKF